MRFITEDELRDIYKRQPFTDYTTAPGERLTPGARQFLLDRGIDVYSNDIQRGVSKVSAGAGVKITEKNHKKYLCRLRRINIRFLLAAEDILERDVCIANQITELSKQMSALINSFEEENKPADLVCNECTGMNSDNFSECLGDCFPMNEFYIQTKKGHEMMVMAELRSYLEELILETVDYLGKGDEEKEISRKLNQILNRLSQLICSALGGTECLRKS